MSSDSRPRNFIRAMGAGYLAIGVNITYTAASVPLALHYLGKEQFGLWALAQQISGYLLLLDLGVSSAVCRFIADHKKEVNSGEYGSLLLTGAVVFAAQGLLIAVLGAAFSFVAPTLFAVPSSLAKDFTNILIAITSLAGISIFSRSFATPLWPFQRMDFSYLMSALSMLSGLISLSIGFHFGFGVYSLAFSGVPAALLVPVFTFSFCKSQGFYPKTRAGWLPPKAADFRRVFAFGKDAALMSLGSQMVNASQIMIISRFVGLDAAATFSVGTKLYSLGQQLVARIVGTAAPALTELFVGGESSSFYARFLDVVSISAFIATLIGSFLICGNSAVVSIWTSEVVIWNPWADLLLAVLLVATAVTRCLNELFVFRGNLKSVRYIYLIEGFFVIVISIPATLRFGLVGLLGTALFVHLVVSLRFSLRAAKKAFVQTKAITFLFIPSSLVFVFLFIFSRFWATYSFGTWITILSSLIFVCVGGLFSWHSLLSRSLRTETFERIHSFIISWGSIFFKASR